MTSLDQLLLERFGWRQFMPLQRSVIECVMQGESTLAVMPTGGGKSLCFQLPALAFPALTVVISPLISLMKDQVDDLLRRKISAIAINSQSSPWENERNLSDIRAGRVSIVYVAPERLKNDVFLEACRSAGVSLIAVDEAHCVSQWGHDFRPEYRLIKDFRQALHDPPLLALTATATPKVQDDIAIHLGIDGCERFIADVDRPNLWLGIESCQTAMEQRKKIVSLVERAEGSTIVYVSSRKDADDLAMMLRNALHEPVHSYHAGLPTQVRTSVQNRFMTGMVRVVTATNAFGMGIDKPDIRAVIHAGIPDSIEAYYQEIGRAGRDGKPAECTIVTVPGMDIRKRQYLVSKDDPTRREVDAMVRRIKGASEQGGNVVSIDDHNHALSVSVMSHLQSLGYITINQRMSTGMRIEMNDINDDNLFDQVWKLVRQHINVKSERFDHMRRFINLDDALCRRQYLTGYFGSEVRSLSDNCCSSCHPRRLVGGMLHQRDIPATTAAALFAAGKTLDDVCNALQCDLTAAWQHFLKWVTGTEDDIWKDQVQRFLTREEYVAIRSKLRGKLRQPIEEVLRKTNGKFDQSKFDLTRAIMLRVGEV